MGAVLQGTIYVWFWSIFNFLLLALIIAIPIFCVVMIFRMDRRLRRLEAKMSAISDQVLPEEPLH